MRTLLLLAIVTLSTFASAQEVDGLKIALWQDGRGTTRAYYHSDEAVVWLVDGGKEITVEAGRTSYFTVESGGTVKLSMHKRTFGKFKQIRLLAGAESFILKSLKPDRVEERYDQGIEIKNEDGQLRIINHISRIDDYVAGVVESESGKSQNLEFYKAQAVICRTYALSNYRRHEHEGFNLCDQVHCQVYHGIARFQPDIVKASQETAGQVLVDSDLELITASFHSNCGGHTVNSEDVWSKALPYLRAKEDTFCLAGKHATWESQVLKSAWVEYLEQHAGDWGILDNSSLFGDNLKERSLFYPEEKLGISTKQLRHKWRLNSTFFKVQDEGDKVLVKGRGFGHGVGLCQEGAMGMSTSGYSYQDILLHYYTDVHLVHQSVLDFFKEN